MAVIKDKIIKNKFGEFILSGGSINSLLKEHRLCLLEKDFDVDISGKLDGNLIIVNKWHNDRRKNFTIAMLLGAYLLKTGNITIFNLYKISINNTDCRDFACELLMPEDKFRKYIDDGINTIQTLADRFTVSLAAVRYRAYQLGYIKKY